MKTQKHMMMSLFIGSAHGDSHTGTLVHSTSQKKAFKPLPRLRDEAPVSSKLNCSPPGRSTSHHRPSPPPPPRTINTKSGTLDYACLGQALKPRKALPVAPGKQGVLHKTATNWNTSRDSVHLDYAQVGRQLLQNGFGVTQAGFMPHVSRFVPSGVHLKENVEGGDETTENYIKAASTFRSRATLSSLNSAGKGPTEPTQPQKKTEKVRTFNWEGIHFEVSPKKGTVAPDMRATAVHAAYSKEMNLMDYDFNNSINRNRSESPKEESEPHTLQKRKSMNFALKDMSKAEESARTIDQRKDKQRTFGSKKSSGGTEDETGTNDSRHSSESPHPEALARWVPKSGKVDGRIRSPPITQIANTISKKLKTVISQHKPGEAGWNDVLHDKCKRYLGWLKCRDKMVDLRSQIQEDIDELSSEDEQ